KTHVFTCRERFPADSVLLMARKERLRRLPDDGPLILRAASRRVNCAGTVKTPHPAALFPPCSLHNSLCRLSLVSKDSGGEDHPERPSPSSYSGQSQRRDRRCGDRDPVAHRPVLNPHKRLTSRDLETDECPFPNT